MPEYSGGNITEVGSVGIVVGAILYVDVVIPIVTGIVVIPIVTGIVEGAVIKKGDATTAHALQSKAVGPTHPSVVLHKILQGVH